MPILWTFCFENKHELTFLVWNWLLLLLGVLDSHADEGLNVVHHLEHGGRLAGCTLLLLLRGVAHLQKGQSWSNIRLEKKAPPPSFHRHPHQRSPCRHPSPPRAHQCPSQTCDWKPSWDIRKHFQGLYIHHSNATSRSKTKRNNNQICVSFEIVNVLT